MFGCDSLEKSRAFSAWRNCHGTVYKVESEPSENLDLAFLDTDNTISLHRFTGGRATTSSSNRKSGPSCPTEKDYLSCSKLVWKEEHIGLRAFYWLIMKRIV